MIYLYNLITFFIFSLLWCIPDILKFLFNFFKTKKVYILFEHTGSWDDAWRHPAKVFKSLKKAEKVRDEENAKILENINKYPWPTEEEGEIAVAAGKGSKIYDDYFHRWNLAYDANHVKKFEIVEVEYD